MCPVIIIVSANSIPQVHEYFPSTYRARSEFVDLLTEIFYLFTVFIEQLSLVFLAYALRNVNDDFKMTKELMVVCVC